MAYKINNNLDHLGFVRVEPSQSLRAYIDSYWFIDAVCDKPRGFQEFLHPDGGMGFIFNYGDNLLFNGQVIQDKACLDGVSTKSTLLILTENIKAAGIRFKPAGASVFLDSPLHELKDQRVSTRDLNSSLFANLYDQISEHKNLNEKVFIIEQALIEALRPDRIISTRMTNAIQQLNNSQGRIALSVLSQQLNINQRKLERLFKKQLGMSGGDYAKIIRIEQARSLLKKTKLPLAEAAYKLSFYDQAHFIKSFKSVVGITPGQYRSNCR